MATDVEVPHVGESITSVIVGRWLKNVGDPIRQGESLVEVDSDKATLEVPAPVDGVLVEQVAASGDEVDVGAVIARIDESALPAAKLPAAETTHALHSPAPKAARAGRVQAGPGARQRAQAMGVDLSQVRGTGHHGRILSKDVEEAARASAPGQGPASSREPAPDAPSVGRVERVKMTPLRRTIARRLVEAQKNAAMLTTFNEVDMKAVIDLRRRYQEAFVKKYGIKLGFMSFFVKACIEALKEYPAANAEIDGDEIVFKHFFHIGVAVSTDRGLVVPVVRDADRLSMAGVERAISDLASRARDGKLTPDDFEGGTFTITNGGIFGSLLSTPILNPPQVAILGMHAIQQRPVGVPDGEGGMKIELRPMMYVALTYDHRIIDGREAVSFLRRVKELVEDPARILIEA